MEVITDKQQINEVLARGVEQVLPTREALAELLASGKRIRLYCGMDPTAPALHIGHALQLRKLRQFQDLGHEVIFLIGSFTAMIGDPTDKLAARTQLTSEQVMANAKSWKKDASKFLRFRGENAAKLMYNHKWLAKLTFEDVVNLSSNFTVQQMMERDMFAKRQAEGKPIHVHEFMYPLMQGYDSVAMDVDLEVGGNDQLFNMLAGRTLQRAIKNREKLVLALKLLTNDEGKKMSKSEGGFIAMTDAPEDMYGKIMAMQDSMIVPYFEIATDVQLSEVGEMRVKLSGGANPRDLKMRLAKTITAMFHGPRAASRAEKHFIGVFQKHDMPEEIREHHLSEEKSYIDILVDTGLAPSRSEAKRLIDQKGVKLDGAVLHNPHATLAPIHLKNGGLILQKGKREFVRLV